MEEEHVLEEGELSDDSDNNYIPLERPTNYSAIQNPVRFPNQKESESEEEEEEISSESDSDSDSKLNKVKRPKIKLKPKLYVNPKRKKYDIWSTRVQEDVLAETLNSCDVTKKDRSRAVESYDYTLGAKYYGNKYDNAGSDARTTNKRTRNDRYNKNIRPIRRCSSSSEEKVKGKARKILELAVTLDNTNEEIAKDIANKLFEEKEELILKVVDVFGKKRTLEIFEETKRIEADGGLLIKNQTRRRTPGGVFLFLVRQHEHITPEQRDKIFSEDKQKEKVNHKKKQRQKLQKYKRQLASKSPLLPDLLTRAEILTSESNRTRNDEDIKDVINPPPTPETDCHENSCDGMDSGGINQVQVCEEIEKMDVRRKVESYDDDFLDIGCSNSMDLF